MERKNNPADSRNWIRREMGICAMSTMAIDDNPNFVVSSVHDVAVERYRPSLYSRLEMRCNNRAHVMGKKPARSHNISSPAWGCLFPGLQDCKQRKGQVDQAGSSTHRSQGGQMDIVATCVHIPIV